MAASTLLLEIGLILAAVAVAGALAHRLGQSVIPFYIVAGLLVGPNGLQVAGRRLPLPEGTGFVVDAAELGIVLLLFFLGLKFSFQQLVKGRARIAKAGAVDMALNLPVGIAIGLVFGFGLVEAILLGGIVYISSSAVITKSLIDLDWIANEESETVLGVLVFEDLFIAVYLILVSAIFFGGGSLEETMISVVGAVVVIGALVAVAGYGARWLGRMVSTPNDELVVLRALAITVLVSGAALALGLSEAVAAFFVGMAFGATELRGRLTRLLAPLRDLFAALFFFWIGLLTDPRLLVTGLGLLAAAVVVTTLTKLASGIWGGRIYGLTPRRQLRVAVGLVPRGEFSLIIAALAAVAGGSPVMTETIPAFTVSYVLVMSILGTLLMQHADLLERFTLGTRPRPRPGAPRP